MAAVLLDKMIYVCDYLMLTTFEEINGGVSYGNVLYSQLNFSLHITGNVD
jgi:hypothetical protein